MIHRNSIELIVVRSRLVPAAHWRAEQCSRVLPGAVLLS